jgi:hypothetical protein
MHMKTLQSLELRLRKLRELHTWQFHAGKYAEMHRTGEKIKTLLDSIVLHYPDWKEHDD